MSTNAQNDSIPNHTKNKSTFLKKQILPASLIVTGSLLNIGNIKYDIQKKIPNANTDIDDYTQFAPMAQMYICDAIGIDHQNSVFDQTKYLIISQVIAESIVFGLKKTTKVVRPSGAATSFPSGHTTFSFVGATVLYHEFKETDLMLAYSGYLFAVTTGVLRLANNAHWSPDVIAGAGIGTLTANLIYHFKPLQSFQPFKKHRDIVVYPSIGLGGFRLMCKF